MGTVIRVFYEPSGYCKSNQLSSRKATPEEIRRYEEQAKEARRQRDITKSMPLKNNCEFALYRCH